MTVFRRMALAPVRDDICAIFVTYHPDAELARRVRAVRPQVGGVVIVDNASGPQALERLRALAAREGISLIENPDNFGVAKALNQGVLQAKASGFSWVLTFDQDSEAGPELVAGLIDVCRSLSPAELEQLGVLGVNHIDANSSETYVAVSGERRPWLERKTVITSGSLMALSVYERVGPFRDEFFIDGIDHEYCLRARSKGYKVLLALAPRLVHAMGHRQRIRVLPGISVTAVNMAPFRWYTVVLNRLSLVREYLRGEPSWSFWRLVNLVKICAHALLFEDRRREKARYMALGLRAFVLNRRVNHPRELLVEAGGQRRAV